MDLRDCIYIFVHTCVCNNNKRKRGHQLESGGHRMIWINGIGIKKEKNGGEGKKQGGSFYFYFN